MVDPTRAPDSPSAPDILVEHSFAGKQWHAAPFDERLSLRLAQQSGLPPLIAQILTARGIRTETFKTFLEPRLRDLPPDPFSLQDMDKAANRIAEAIQAKERIALFGDYDVDGATSTALMMRFLKSVGLIATFYIPDRVKEGYGPNTPAIENLCTDHDLIITLDCGITAFEPLAKAKEMGTDVVVLDHHAAEPELPTAVAVVNPNRLDDTSGQNHMAAVGVTFLSILATIKILEDANFFVTTPKPDARQWLDIVALGTVCDVVSLTGVNRAFVAQGLKVMAMRQNPGISALSDLANLDEKPNTYHAGFVLGPRINAGGRVGDANLGAQLLYEDDPQKARQIAQVLDQNNRDRQDIEKASLAEAVIMAEETLDDQSHLLFVIGKDWHPGIIGLISSRLKERYNRPVCAIALDQDGVGKASGRSIKGIDLGNLIIAARQKGLLINGGGHTMAAGFTVAADQIDALHAFMTERIIAENGSEPLKPIVSIDSIASPQSITLDLARNLDRLGPFGMGNPQPRFMLKNCRIIKMDVLKDVHLRMILGDSTGQGSLKAMSFRAVESPMGQALLKLAPSTLIHVAGTIRLNQWQGRETAEFTVDDAVLA